MRDFVPVDGTGKPLGSVAALSRDLRRWRAICFAAAGLLVITIAIDGFVQTVDRSHWLQLLLNVLYGLAVALLVTVAVYWYVAVIALRSAKDADKPGLAVLGLGANTTIQPGATVLVLPTFRSFDDPEVLSMSPAPRNVDRARWGTSAPVGAFFESIRWRMPDSLGLNQVTLGTSAHSRSDVLAMNDVLRLIAQAGRPHPLVVSDRDFIRAVNDTPDGVGLRIRPGSVDGNDEEVRVSNVICIGMYSNALTCALADSRMIPLRLVPDAQFRQENKLAFRMSRTWQPGTTTDDSDDQTSEERTDDVVIDPRWAPAFVGKFGFRDVVLSVLGGYESIGTVRLGDFITQFDINEPKFRDLAFFDECWTVLECPAEGKRYSKFDVLLPVKPSKHWSDATDGSTIFFANELRARWTIAASE